jgi:hypothetical protein
MHGADFGLLIDLLPRLTNHCGSVSFRIADTSPEWLAWLG